MGKKVDLEQVLEEILESRQLAWEAYIKFHTNNEIPAWIILNGKTRESRVTNGVWLVMAHLMRNHILPPGIFWERRTDGSNEFVSRDLATGERTILISYDLKDSEMMQLFNAEVHLPSRMVTMNDAVTVEQLQSEDFMLEYDDFSKYDNLDLAKKWRFDQSPEQNRRNILAHL